MLWEVVRYLSRDWISRYYIKPDFFFTYWGFDWIHPWTDEWMYVHFLGLGILSVFIMLGVWYRTSAILFFVGFTYIFLLDQTNYLNHFYLISLISFLMIFVPAHRGASFDVIRQPNLQVETCPAWSLWLLRAQVSIAYFYGGIAKMNGDWFRGDPMRMWLADRTDFPIIGDYFLDPSAAYVFSYGGLLFDLLIVPLLLWPRTRTLTYLLALGFHLTNVELFSIGIFPWFMIGATLLFFNPDQFIPFRRRVEQFLSPSIKFTRATIHTSDIKKKLILRILIIYMIFQVLVPLRHFLYPGNVSWTEEGHRFSWHMKLRSKRGTITFTALDPITKDSWEIDPYKYLSSRQVSKMEGSPDRIVQFSHYLDSLLRDAGYPNIEIRVKANISLNGREPQLLIDPTVDMTKVERSLMSSNWILPLANN